MLFQKCLTTLDLTSLGVGSCCGTGMYLVAGMVARNIAGPGVVFSFIIAAVASIFSGEKSISALSKDSQLVQHCKDAQHTIVVQVNSPFGCAPDDFSSSLPIYIQ